MINLTGQAVDGYHLAGMMRITSAADSDDTSGRGTTEGESSDPELEEVAREEHEYVRRRLREELKREPTEEEMDEWLRQQTEGH